MVRNSSLSQEENAAYRAILEKQAGKVLTLFFKFYRNTPVCRSVVYLASLCSYNSVAPVASFCLSRSGHRLFDFLVRL